MAEVQPVYSVTLSTGKKVIMREMTIKIQNLAAKAVGKAADDNKLLAASLMAQEMVKQLIISIDGKTLTGLEKEKLDEVLNYKEFQQVLKVVEKISDGDAEGEPSMEIVTGGAL